MDTFDYAVLLLILVLLMFNVSGIRHDITNRRPTEVTVKLYLNGEEIEVQGVKVEYQQEAK